MSDLGELDAFNAIYNKICSVKSEQIAIADELIRREVVTVAGAALRVASHVLVARKEFLTRLGLEDSLQFIIFL